VTRIDFYVLAEKSRQDRDRYACGIVQKAWRNDHQVYVQVDTPERSNFIDELMWTFRDISFVPHCVLETSLDPAVRVFISHQAAPPDYHDVLINLSGNVPATFSQFERVIEIVDDDDENRRRARERFSFYRNRGYEMTTHQVA
jgi:DNA polymerase-3 subunit chi